MPSEVLFKVFALSDYSLPISGSLLAYTRVSRYREIYITTSEEMQALCNFIATDAHLGGLVRTLRIRLKREPSPPRWEMVALYHALDKLESLEVLGGLVDLILSHEVASTCFPRLDTLELDHPFQQTDNPLDPARFAFIELYRELTFLKVTLCKHARVSEGTQWKRWCWIARERERIWRIGNRARTRRARSVEAVRKGGQRRDRIASNAMNESISTTSPQKRVKRPREMYPHVPQIPSPVSYSLLPTIPKVLS